MVIREREKRKEKYITMFDEKEFKAFIDKNMSISYERRLQRIRLEYLTDCKEEVTEFLLNLFITAIKYPENFKELYALADGENKKSVTVAREAFEGDFIEMLCSIKKEVPICFLDEYAALLMKFGKNMYFNDAKQDWYKQKNIKIPKSFDVKDKEYCGYPISFEIFKSGKTLIIR
jgi:hypothetical protein